jgi:glycosyltransferase involved in cell wall biosynthesis
MQRYWIPTLNNFPKMVSSRLEQFPHLWRFLFRVYGVNSFDQKNLKYRKGSSVLEDERTVPSEFEVIFDAQCLQTLTRQRGIGKYSLSLIEATCKGDPEKKFAAYLTNIASRAELEIAKNLLRSLKCNNLTILVMDPFEASNKITFAQSQEFLQASLKSFVPKVVISLSNFEKPETSIPLPPGSDYLTSAILYDLIPLQFPKQLLVSRRQKSTYQWLLSNLQKFDFLLSISKTTQGVWRELVSNSTRVGFIGGAGYDFILKEAPAFGDRNGVLCIGSEQEHKNLKMLILAYSMLPLNMRSTQKLTIVGIRSSGTRRKLTKIAKRLKCHVWLPTYLTEKELRNLYQSNRILVMPSLSEGLSLPILEAWANGLPAIGSSGTVAGELIQENSLLFDPTNPNSIMRTIEFLLFNQTEWETALRHSQKMAKSYSWELTAQLTLKVISEMTICE